MDGFNPWGDKTSLRFPDSGSWGKGDGDDKFKSFKSKDVAMLNVDPILSCESSKGCGVGFVINSGRCVANISDDILYDGTFSDGCPNGQGTLTHKGKNGYQIKGTFRDGFAHGFCSKTVFPQFPFLSVEYQGEFVRGVPTGEAEERITISLLTYDEYISTEQANTSVADSWKFGRDTGNDTETPERTDAASSSQKTGLSCSEDTGEILYRGHYIDGKREGKGVLTYSDKCNSYRYEGMWTNGMPGGSGVSWFRDSSDKRPTVFEGNFCVPRGTDTDGCQYLYFLQPESSRPSFVAAVSPMLLKAEQTVNTPDDWKSASSFPGKNSSLANRGHHRPMGHRPTHELWTGKGVLHTPDGRSYQGVFCKGSITGVVDVHLREDSAIPDTLLEVFIRSDKSKPVPDTADDTTTRNQRGDWSSSESQKASLKAGRPSRSQQWMTYRGQVDPTTLDLAGNGIVHYRDGRVVSGSFKADKIHGWATTKFPDGTVLQAEWVMGKPQSRIALQSLLHYMGESVQEFCAPPIGG